MLSGLVNLMYRTRYSDLCYGFNAFWRRHVPLLGFNTVSSAEADGNARLWGDGFEVETLINIRVARAGLIVKEVASYEYRRIHGVSNLNAMSDGLRVLFTILSEHYRSNRPRMKAVHSLANLNYADLTLAGHPVEDLPNRGSIIHVTSRPEMEN